MNESAARRRARSKQAANCDDEFAKQAETAKKQEPAGDIAARARARCLLRDVDHDATTEWEDDFLSDLEDRLLDVTWEPTLRQLEKLEEIAYGK